MDSPPVPRNPPDPTARFVELLTGHQRKLYAYIIMMLCGDSAAADVLQETNLDLWKQMAEYDFDRPFLPWAFGFARQRVLAFRRSHHRSRLMFGEEAFSIINDAAADLAAEADERLAALRDCLRKLSPQQSEMIRQRYFEKIPVKRMAEKWHEKVNNISSRLHRIRKSLARCIDAAITAEGR